MQGPCPARERLCPRYAAWQTAFNKLGHEMELLWKAKRDALPPGSIDVLLTHMPPAGIGDMEPGGSRHGCEHLKSFVLTHLRPQFHVFGHVHSDSGVHEVPGASRTVFVNAASVSDFYTVGGRTPFEFECGCVGPP